MGTTLISVVLPCYRHARYVEEAIRSVAAQTHPDIELIVVDDASDDGSAEVVAGLLEQPTLSGRFVRSQLVAKPVNQGAHAAINDGLALAQGRWLAILNTDDRYHPQRLQTLLAAASAAGSEFVFSDVRCIDEHGQRNRSALALSLENAARRARAGVPTTGFGFLASQIATSTGNFMFTRGLYDEVGPFSALRYCHDWDFAVRAVCVTEPVHVEQALYDYRLHTGNSFLQLGDVAQRETRLVQQTLRAAQFSRMHRNPLAPLPCNWPGVFALQLRRAGLEALWGMRS